MSNTIELTPTNTTNMSKGNRNSSVLIGAFILLVGVLMLLRRIGLPLPHWLLSWEMALIGVGIIMGLKSGFKDIAWIIPIVLGLIFISDDVFPYFSIGRLFWPLGLIAAGAIILTKGNRRKSSWTDSNLQATDNTPVAPTPPTPPTGFTSNFKPMDENGNIIEPVTPTPQPAVSPDTNDVLDVAAVFGGVKRTVVSKNFCGGEIVAVFGGAEIDFTHADINGVVKLEATNVLGGTKIIVPAHWDIQSEMVAVFGGVEDKRRIQPERIDRNKRLILTGTAFLGGLEIKSF